MIYHVKRTVCSIKVDQYIKDCIKDIGFKVAIFLIHSRNYGLNEKAKKLSIFI